MSKSYYDILEVDKTANPEKIKRAYRRKATGAHPDKGGSAEEMAEINRAYSCLKDAQRKLTYDQTGQDKPHPPIESAVRDILMEVFNDIIEKEIVGDCIGRASLALQSAIEELKKQQSDDRKKRRDLLARRDKVKTKNGENIFHMLIDHKVQEIDGRLLQSRVQNKSLQAGA